MIGVDTNILLRLLTEDDAAQLAAVHRLLTPLDNVAESVFINDIVLVETLWTLRRSYGRNKDDVLAVLHALLSAVTFRFENRDFLTKALSLYENSSADFSDCLIVAKNSGAGCDYTATFDRAMEGLAGVQKL